MDGITTCVTPPRPPRLPPTYEELGPRLTAFARRKGVPFEFHILPQPLESLQASDFGLREEGAQGVNCVLRLHYLADETVAGPTNHLQHHHHEQSRSSSTPGDFASKFIITIPSRQVEAEAEAGLEPCHLHTVRRGLQNHLPGSRVPSNIPIMASSGSPSTLWPHPRHLSVMRLEQEQEVDKNIENIVTYEGVHRIERLESKTQW